MINSLCLNSIIINNLLYYIIKDRMMDYFIADTHLGYDKVAEERGFDTIEYHDNRVAKDVVKPLKFGDTLYIIGDITSRFASEQDYRSFFDKLCNAYNYVHSTSYHRLPFKINIIMGNHDEFKILDKMIRQGFIDNVYASMEIPVIGHDYSVVVTHIPLHPNEMTKETRWKLNVHGHLHEYRVNSEKYYCVSYDRVINPVSLNDIKNIALSINL